jgi:hypothetical protein
VAIEVSNADYLSQQVKVEPRGQYDLRFYAKGASDTTPVAFQVNWLDAQNQPCGKFARVTTVGKRWQLCVARMQAPPSAESAQVMAVGASNQAVMQDTFSFRQLQPVSDGPR